MGNLLGGETSPYLHQHRDNPVHWRPWGEDAMREARDRDVPVLLSVGYSACHWCHVMERESFEDEGTAAFMNEHFVNVKVDREERPDVDALYMEAVQAMTGHGGWPMTVFLDPEGVPFYGGTYFPPEPRHGMPSFVQVMQAVVSAFRERREEIRARAPRTRAQLGALGELRAPEDGLDPSLPAAAEASLLQRADLLRGGFGGAPKFPPASALEFLMGRRSADGLAVVERTLDRMAAGGIYDHLGGGFARYSTDDEWLVPHFEKMLYDNALLARSYLHGWQVLGHDRYRRACEETLDWALREMRGAEGGFFSAIDADSEGEEGRFYVWDAEELREELGPDADDFMAYYGVSDAGNFEGHNILHLPAGGPDPPANLGDLRRQLYETRARRVWPGIDDKRLTAWNALMVTALAEAGWILRRDSYLDAAREAAGFILGELRDEDGRLLRTYKDGRAHLNAYLEDHAFLLEALLGLYEATFEVRWYEEAVAVAEAMIERFGDPERGGFFTTSSDHEKLIARRKDLGDHPIPSGNSSAALGLLRLHGLSGEERYETAALGVLRLISPAAAQHPDGFGHLLQALDFHLSGSRELALVAAAEPRETGDALEPFLELLRSEHRPRLVLAGGREGVPQPPLMRDRPAAGGSAAAYLCERFACQAPVATAEELAALLT